MMIGPEKRRTASRAQPNSRWFGLAVALAYVVVSAVIGAALLAGGPREDSGTSAAGTPLGATARYTDTTTITLDPTTTPPAGSPSAARTTPQPPVSTTSSATQKETTRTTTEQAAPRLDAAPGYQPVTGPGGMTTVVPDGWLSSRTTGPGAMEAIDPADPLRFVKYGGSEAVDDLVSTHLDYEESYSARTEGYDRALLQSLVFHDSPAVEWEFDVAGPSGQQHYRSIYWRANGFEYFVLASAPTTRWAALKPAYDAMLAAATP